VLRAAEGFGSPVDVFTYNTLITGYCRVDDTCSLLDDMVHHGTIN
jgi:pentatricopeptide repeat protein